MEIKNRVKFEKEYYTKKLKHDFVKFYAVVEKYNHVFTVYLEPVFDFYCVNIVTYNTECKRVNNGYEMTYEPLTYSTGCSKGEKDIKETIDYLIDELVKHYKLV